MKRIIALCLTIVMLLGMVSMVASANEVEYFTGVSLALRESIAISFKADKTAIQENFTKVEFVKNGNVVQTIDTLPEANEEGKVAFACTKIAPSEMGTDITAKLYLGETVADELTASVYDYCAAVLADENAAAELKTLVVDMLNYGTATQTYINDTNAKVNAELTPEQQALGTAADAELPLENIMALGADPEGASVTWTSAALSLRESVAISYKFAAASVEGLSVALACGDNSWTVNSFKDEGDGVYSFRFTGLNPAMMRDAVTAVVMNGETAVSPELTYSIESYAAQVVADTNADANLVALVKAMMRYGDAAAAYVEGAPAHRYDENGRCTVCANAHFTAGKNVYIETETVDLLTNAGDDPLFTEAPLVAENNAKWSGGTAIRSNKGYTATNGYDADAVPHISFTVTPEKDGTYYIWIRGNNTTNDFKYFVDDDNNTQVKYELTEPGSDGTSEKWYCLPDSYTWTAGNDYMVRFRIHHTLVRWDQFVITSDASFNPDTHTHTAGTEYSFDGDNHWTNATCCYGVKSAPTAHSYTNGVCVCGKPQYLYETIEAEDCALTTTFEERTDLATIVDVENASGGKAVEMAGRVITGHTYSLAGNPKTISFTYTPEVTDTYFVWVYLKNQGSTTNLRSFVDGVDTGDNYLNETVYFAGYPREDKAAYGWYMLGQYEYNSRMATWTAGETYEVKLTNYHNVTIDKFVVTTDPTYAPNGANIEVNTENGLVTVQAENVIQNYAMASVNGTTAVKFNTNGSISSASAWKTYHETEKNLPAGLGFKVNADVAGTYNVWAKVKLDNLNRKLVYISLAADGAEYTYQQVDLNITGAVANTYHWVKVGTYTTTAAGEGFFVRMRNHDANMCVDEFVITNIANYDPANPIVPPELGPNMTPIG